MDIDCRLLLYASQRHRWTVLGQSKSPSCVFFHALTVRATQPWESISHVKGARGTSQARFFWLTSQVQGHVARENSNHDHVAAERDGTYARMGQAMLTGPCHPKLWTGCWFPDGNLSLWLRDSDLGPKHRGMLSAGSEELSGSMSAAAWLYHSHSCWFGVRGKTLLPSLPLVQHFGKDAL